ncbi:response regulator [Rhodovulum sulfidophilum]|uniref:response regulator n=1 Tax=Rhodovulum sulfidophilum TaxID=35806 RepID=UPI0013899DB4|nr:response regulator [Rhodovulum sulfidophilum]NDK35141.1 response regulator [Rhodovulum sulfidophilum]
MDDQNPRSLLVEDDGLIRMDLAIMLEEMGYSLTEASSADQALELLNESNGFELLVTDIDMPGAMDGLALAVAVRDRLPQCQILIVSGGRPPRPDEMPAGSRFLPKPVTSSALEETIRALNAA